MGDDLYDWSDDTVDYDRYRAISHGDRIEIYDVENPKDAVVSAEYDEMYELSDML